MKLDILRIVRLQLAAVLLIFTTIGARIPSVYGQKPVERVAKPSPQSMPQSAAPTFDSLLAADTYKIYGEVRNVGQLMSTGGAGEIVDPIMKLADPPKEFKSVVKFLKANAEALASSRLLFATWPARPNVPNFFAAIEFSTPEEAAKFAPKIETFLPTVLPPVPVEAKDKASESQTAQPAGPGTQPAANRNDQPAGNNSSVTPGERLPFVISHAGTLVFITDQPFKPERIHPLNSKALAEDQNFRIAHDRFSSEPIFVYFNVVLEERSKRQQIASVSQLEAEQVKPKDTEVAAAQPAPSTEVESTNVSAPVPVETPAATPEPTPDKPQQTQAIATNHAGRMLDYLGMGQSQMPEAVGLALVLDNNEYVIRAMVIDAPNAKRLPIPFIPQMVSGPATGGNVMSVLPDDTEAFVTASINLTQTYEGMRKQAEARAKTDEATLRKAQLPGTNDVVQDPFTEFEKKAGFKIKEDLLPLLGNEIAIAGSLSSLQGAGGFNLGITNPSSTASQTGTDKDPKKKASAFPVLAISIKDRDGVSRLMPGVLTGLGVGEANLLAQKEVRGDAEIVSYAGMFAYAFVGDFLVLSDAATVRHLVEAVANHQTLSSNTIYRNSSRWQPRENLGQIYISPALMETYQEQVHRQAATMDPAMRDFLMKLSPESGAITYALSNDGLGTLHELHLPKNLILSMVAGISSTTKNPPPEMNESVAIAMLQMISSAEASYRVDTGGYGSLDQLVEKKLVQGEMLDKYGYKFEVIASGDHFEAVATPVEYGKTGKRSFFIDQSNVVRGDDHGGAPATVADKSIGS